MNARVFATVAVGILGLGLIFLGLLLFSAMLGITFAFSGISELPDQFTSFTFVSSVASFPTSLMAGFVLVRRRMRIASWLVGGRSDTPGELSVEGGRVALGSLGIYLSVCGIEVMVGSVASFVYGEWGNGWESLSMGVVSLAFGLLIAF